MYERGLLESFTGGYHTDMRELLTTKDENGETASGAIIARLREYDRAQPIVTSFTKISLAVMHGTEDFSEEADKLYENVKSDVSSALTHNKSDFETEEEYKQAVNDDLSKALEDNNLNVDEETKKVMVDYIADNYGDHEGEITDKEINDALLSYYKSYAESLGQGGVTPPVDEGNGAEN
jgi:hypothetical protein